MLSTVLRGLACLLLLLALALPAWAQEARGVGVVTALSGRADLKRPQAPEAAALKLRDNLFVRDVVDTHEKSLARMLLLGKSTVTVRELSRFEIREEALADGGQRATINLAEGRIRVMVVRRLMRPGDEIRIQTPNAIAGVRGTDGIVEVTTLPDGRPQTTITGVSGEFAVTLPTTPPFVARGREFTDGPAYAGGPLLAMAEGGRPVQVAQLTGLLVTALLQAQITGAAGVQALATALLTQTQVNQVLQNFQVNLGAMGAGQPPPAANDRAAAQGLQAAFQATLASGAQPLPLGGGPPPISGPPLPPPPILPTTGGFQTISNGNGITVVPFTGDVIASQTFNLVFNSASDIKSFQVVTNGTAWFVSVRDCCIVGDIWRATISHGGKTLTSSTGDGNTATFSPPAGVSSSGPKTFDVKVTYVSGVDAFPAGMETKFDTTSGSITVTQK
jgi:hypothetical protein